MDKQLLIVRVLGEDQIHVDSVRYKISFLVLLHYIMLRNTEATLRLNGFTKVK